MATEDLTARLEAAVGRLERVARKLGGGGDEEKGGPPAFVTEWESLCAKELKKVLETAAKIKLPTFPDIIEAAFNNTTALIKAMPHCKKPKQAELMQALAPISAQLGAADGAKYGGGREWKDHFVACCELVQSLQWLVTAPPMGTTVGHCKGQSQAVDFNLNRVIKRLKDADTKAWNLAMRAICKKQEEYVKEFFATGLIWNPKGVELSKFDPSKVAAAPTKATATGSAASGGARDGDISAVFGELSKGLAVTGGLKKVQDKDKTKYRKDRSGKVAMRKPKPKVTRKKGAPATRYVGGRWMVENHNEGRIEMDKATAKQNVYIAMCDLTTIAVVGKVKAVTVDSCVKCTVYVDEVISTVEMINCKNTTIVIKKKAPTLSVEKSSSPKIVLLKEAYAVGPDIYTSNVSAMNVEVPGADGADPVDVAIPEQFVTKIDPVARTAETTHVVHG